MLIHAFVISKLDIGNSLLYNIPLYLLDKLQLALNSAARILSRTSKYDHITPVLQTLHWLPIRQRIEFKILLQTWKILHGVAPCYLNELVRSYVPQRNLRSSNRLLLETQKTRVTYGNRAFFASAPDLWNRLPLELKTIDSLEVFKSKLKSYLFSVAY